MGQRGSLKETLEIIIIKWKLKYIKIYGMELKQRLKKMYAIKCAHYKRKEALKPMIYVSTLRSQKKKEQNKHRARRQKEKNQIRVEIDYLENRKIIPKKKKT